MLEGGALVDELLDLGLQRRDSLLQIGHLGGRRWGRLGCVLQLLDAHGPAQDLGVVIKLCGRTKQQYSIAR